MANALYGKGKEHLLNGDIDIDTATIKAILLSDTYVPNMGLHETVADVSASRLNTDRTLTSVTKTLGVVDAADVTFTAVAAGSTAKYVALYKDSGSTATSWLIALYDTITNFPVSTNGSDIVIQWDNGVNKLFAL